MIKFLSVQIENFLSIQQATLSLADQGLVLIEGVNKDDPSALSNGAGKSSMVDAIMWALYGQTARGLTADGVVNAKIGKDTLVCVTVEIDGLVYNISRGRKHRTLKNRVTVHQDRNDLTLGTNDLTQERINHLLGCDATVFKSAIYMGQEAMPNLPDLTDRQLKGILESALSLDKLDEAQAVCKAKLHTAQYDADMLRLECENARERAKDMTKQLSGLFARRDVLENSIEAEHKLLVERRASLAHSTKELERLEKEKLTRPPLPPGINMAAIEAEANVDPEYTGLTTTITSLYETKSKIADRLAAVKATKASLAQKLEDEVACPTCGRNYDTECAFDITAVKDSLNKAISDVAKLQNKLEEIDAKINAAQKQKIQFIYDLVNNKSVDRDIAERAERELSKNIHAAATDIKLHQAAMENYKRTIQLWFQEQTKINHEIKETEQAFEEANRLIAAKETQIEHAVARVAVLEKVSHVLSRKGFRGEVLDQITPYLNDRTQYYLNQLSDNNMEAVWNTVSVNASGDYTENFHIKVEHKSGVNSFSGLSGGEKRKVRLACALALQDMVGTRAIKPINLFIADEIDDALDGAGLELLMNLLEEKARQVGTVFVISHNDLGDWVRNKITVVKKDGLATIKTPS